MNEEKLKLLKFAADERKLSYCPYSKKSVGAALLSRNGKIYLGANIENASFGATNCAERVAMQNAIIAGEREFSAIAVEGGDAGLAPEGFFAPCGICRQALSEFCGRDFKIYLSGKEGETREFTLGELLPEAFSLSED